MDLKKVNEGNLKVYVMPYENKWAVKTGRSENPNSVHDSKKQAIDAAKEIAMASRGKLILMDKDGNIENLNETEINPMPDINNAPDYNPDEKSDEDY